MKKLIPGFILLVLLTPLGLLTPGTAWGEWGLEEINGKAGFIPQGMQRLSELMKVILPDYGIPGFDKSFWQAAVGYIFSAMVGITVIALVFWLFAKLWPDDKAKTNSGTGQ